MIEIVPELWPYGHCSSPNFSLFVQNLDYKPQSIIVPGEILGNKLQLRHFDVFLIEFCIKNWTFLYGYNNITLNFNIYGLGAWSLQKIIKNDVF